VPEPEPDPDPDPHPDPAPPCGLSAPQAPPVATRVTVDGRLLLSTGGAMPHTVVSCSYWERATEAIAASLEAQWVSGCRKIDQLFTRWSENMKENAIIMGMEA